MHDCAWVGRQANDEVEGVASGRCTHEEDGDAEMEGEGCDGSLEGSVFHEEVGKGENPVLGQFLNDSCYQELVIAQKLRDVRTTYGR